MPLRNAVLKSALAAAATLSLAACVTAPAPGAPQAAAIPDACPTPVAAVLAPMVGNWRLALQADEGWTGYGTSTISWDNGRACALSERSEAVFNQESETPFENQSTVLLAYDALSETIKTLTADNRGYVHLGGSSVEAPLRFAILKSDSAAPTRQIQYRALSETGFEWVWQGRADADAPWADRLIITYRRVADLEIE